MSNPTTTGPILPQPSQSTLYSSYPFEQRESLGPEAQIKVARASLFAAQAIARKLIADGREQEVQEIREFISTIVPDPEAAQTAQAAQRTEPTEPEGQPT